MIKLSKRMKAVASMVTQGYKLCDVGTDHGYVPISLVTDGTIPEAIAVDINKGPLERANLHIRSCGLEDKTFRWIVCSKRGRGRVHHHCGNGW